MRYRVLKGSEAKALFGCDFVIRLGVDKLEAKILQLTDTQIIDSVQIRPDRKLSPEEASEWRLDNFDRLCGDYICRLIENSFKLC